jgi:predicted XRE-type DNA-binding protein
MEQPELIQLMERWQQAEPAHYKTRIKTLCDQQNIKTRHIVEVLDIKRPKAVSFINPLHPGRIEFYDAVRLAELLLKVKVEIFLEEF